MSDHKPPAPRTPPQTQPYRSDPIRAATDFSGTRAEPTLDTGLQAHIGRHLRALYEDVVEQPVPGRFARLLEELENKRAHRP